MTEETLDALRRLLYVPDLAGVSVMRLQPNDVILVEVDGKVSDQESANLHFQLQQVWPEHQVLICDDGLRLRIARAGESDEPDEPDVAV